MYLDNITWVNALKSFAEGLMIGNLSIHTFSHWLIEVLLSVSERVFRHFVAFLVGKKYLTSPKSWRNVSAINLEANRGRNGMFTDKSFIKLLYNKSFSVLDGSSSC
jgi:hypothetical protein